MPKVRTFIIFGINLTLMFISWFFFKYPQGDEYLVLFMIPLIFIVVPFILTFAEIAALFLINLAFFIFYYFIGALNIIDIVVLMTLLGSISGGSQMVKLLRLSYEEYQNKSLLVTQSSYNRHLGELESINRKGRRVENELTRISRLYELTKKLVPALKFDDLVAALFDFLENNFTFEKIHMFIIGEDKSVRELSKRTGVDNPVKEPKTSSVKYRRLFSAAKKNRFEPFTIDRSEESRTFDEFKAKNDNLMVFPLSVGDKLAAIMAVEGAYKGSFSRFKLLIPQIALGLRKVGLYEKVQKLSIIDGLTEVYLRRYLMDRLEEEVDRSGRLGLTFSIGMVDVDHFKKCNDKWGHLVGDAVLREIAERLKKSVREVDMISRYGGEEFCIVLPETGKDLAMSVAERLRSMVETGEVKAFDVNVKVTVSVGIATYPRDGATVSSLIEKADAALYTAKRRGRNNVCRA